MEPPGVKPFSPQANSVSCGSHGSNEKKTSGVPRKRPFRPRSVTSLTREQLLRKRANDRDSQRAIRQRTKSTIEGLQRTVFDLESRHTARENLIPELQHRICQLEQERSYLHSRLKSSGSSLHVPATREHIRRGSANFQAATDTTKVKNVQSTRSESSATTYGHPMEKSSPDVPTVSNSSQPVLANGTTASDPPSGVGNSCTNAEAPGVWRGFDMVVEVDPLEDGLRMENTSGGLNSEFIAWSGNGIQQDGSVLQQQQPHDSSATASFASNSSNTSGYSSLPVSPASTGLASTFPYPIQCGELNFQQTLGFPVPSVFPSTTDAMAYPFHHGHLQTPPFVTQTQPPNEPLKCTSHSIPLSRQDHDGCACQINQLMHMATN